MTRSVTLPVFKNLDWKRFGLALICFLFSHNARPQNPVDFSKNGEIHEQVIHLWNTHYRDYFASEIQRRLFEQGDVYVLYDVQIGGLQSFVEMTRRCKDTPQIGELVELLNPVLSKLEPISATDESTGWICNGGHICTAYGFLGKEVRLCSAQFLGLLGALATSISENIRPHRRTAAENEFVSHTFNTMAVQMNRWLTSSYFASVERRLPITTTDIKDGNSRFYFSDQDLWFLTILSDLSALHRSGIRPAKADGKKAFDELRQKTAGIQKIFDLFLARAFLSPSPGGMRADLDRGFWKFHFDTRYAGYTGDQSPVSWKENRENKAEMITSVPWDNRYLAADAGWDISHARRLVPALETFTRNRKHIRAVWEYDNPAFDPEALRQAFANQLVEKIWNGDLKYPLFSNFWSGDNGWYRVAYANQTGRQFVGYPPYGLSISIPSGGYPVWGAFHPTLRTIFNNIYQLSQTDDAEATSFVSKYYTSAKRIQSLSFLSDLVALP